MTMEELCKYIGQTVIIFTTSGGASGCGFTGVLLRVNPCFCTLVNRLGSSPSNPLSETICGDRRNGNGNGRDCRDMDDRPVYTVGSVCDIPLDRIAAFCHNAI
ncbi:MAG: hypothetical protein K0R00_314 [Herbinix sp.]|jgi:hypothetical protein|nr:hypothetical protein [Herbinix sp.]